MFALLIKQHNMIVFFTIVFAWDRWFSTHYEYLLERFTGRLPFLTSKYAMNILQEKNSTNMQQSNATLWDIAHCLPVSVAEGRWPNTSRTQHCYRCDMLQSRAPCRSCQGSRRRATSRCMSGTGSWCVMAILQQLYLSASQRAGCSAHASVHEHSFRSWI